MGMPAGAVGRVGGRLGAAGIYGGRCGLLKVGRRRRRPAGRARDCTGRGARGVCGQKRASPERWTRAAPTSALGRDAGRASRLWRAEVRGMWGTGGVSRGGGRTLRLAADWARCRRGPVVGWRENVNIWQLPT